MADWRKRHLSRDDIMGKTGLSRSAVTRWLAALTLHDAAQRSSSDAVGRGEVRPALYVLRPFKKDSKSLVEFWTAATAEPRHPWTSCHLPYRLIVQQLVDLGEAVDKARQP